MASVPITSWQIDGGKVETVTFSFLSRSTVTPAVGLFSMFYMAIKLLSVFSIFLYSVHYYCSMKGTQDYSNQCT